MAAGSILKYDERLQVPTDLFLRLLAVFDAAFAPVDLTLRQNIALTGKGIVQSRSSSFTGLLTNSVPRETRFPQSVDSWLAASQAGCHARRYVEGERPLVTTLILITRPRTDGVRCAAVMLRTSRVSKEATHQAGPQPAPALPDPVATHTAAVQG